MTSTPEPDPPAWWVEVAGALFGIACWVALIAVGWYYAGRYW
jgi:hypothetical protein